MAATDRQYQDLISGVTDATLGDNAGGTDLTLSASILADLVAIADPEFIAITLDPERENGDPEIIWVTAHTASATTATIARGREGTTARAHASGTKLVAGLTKQTVEDLRAATTEDLVPVGAIMPFGGSSAPSFWLLCDGRAVSRSTYADLFSEIGTTFGAGDGSTTFNVPDLRQRFPLGKAASGTGSTLGGTGGAIDHTHTGPSHTHTGPSHAHSNPDTGIESQAGVVVEEAGGAPASPVDVAVEDHTHPQANTGASGTGNTGAAGTGNTSASNPPFLAVHFIIKA